MNQAHLHLILVHVPIVLVPTGVAILVCGLFMKNITVQKTALSVFIIATLFTVAAFLLGEGAEHIAKKTAGIVKSTIETHSDAGDFALWITVALGLISIVGIFSSLALARTAYLGGMIRHPEAYEQHTSEK